MDFKKGVTNLSEMLERAHENGIICNISGLNNSEEIQEYFKMGVDTILTDNYLKNIYSR